VAEPDNPPSQRPVRRRKRRERVSTAGQTVATLVEWHLDERGNLCRSMGNEAKPLDNQGR